ncbi:MAG: hypothetical protein R3E94_12500 [Burkholderiaceae bacterium]
MSDVRQHPKRHFITSEDVRQAAANGLHAITLDGLCTVTDEARELAYSLGMRVENAKPACPAATASSATPTKPAPASADKPCIANAIAAVVAELPDLSRDAGLIAEVTRRVMAALARTSAAIL